MTVKKKKHKFLRFSPSEYVPVGQGEQVAVSLL